jgi:hypothetical protein
MSQRTLSRMKSLDGLFLNDVSEATLLSRKVEVVKFGTRHIVSLVLRPIHHSSKTVLSLPIAGNIARLCLESFVGATLPTSAINFEGVHRVSTLTN